MIIKALTLGFSTGFFCLGYCIPIVGPFMLSKKDSTLKGSASALGLFIAGRLIAYIIFGLFVGLLGYHTKNMAILHAKVVPVIFILLGCIMILYGAAKILPNHNSCSLSQKYLDRPWHLFALGILAGINICPPFLLALSYAFSLKAVGKSTLFFLLFFVATSVFLLPLLFSGAVSRFKDVRIAARITAIIAGGWFIISALRRLLLF